MRIIRIIAKVIFVVQELRTWKLEKKPKLRWTFENQRKRCCGADPGHEMKELAPTKVSMLVSKIKGHGVRNRKASSSRTN